MYEAMNASNTNKFMEATNMAIEITSLVSELSTISSNKIGVNLLFNSNLKLFLIFK